MAKRFKGRFVVVTEISGIKGSTYSYWSTNRLVAACDRRDSVLKRLAREHFIGARAYVVDTVRDTHVILP